MFDTLYAQVGAALMVSVSAFAFIKGQDPERFGAGAYLLAWFATLLLQDDIGLYNNAPILFGIDVFVLIVFCGLSWKSANTWPVWAAALQLLPVLSHVMMAVDVRPPAASFYAIQNLASIGILVAIALGTFWTWQERRAAGLE
ncbi:hypothetical protein [Brevundimonas balnearis]|uniref:Uncharacterized protein n=1 Tax=Brevundimonas balnearis TaxID=1572858 RepID=A0ABV6QY36_9CAUL